nr:MAG TPA: hypothetical protein [Caudoviricetes sp.]
MYNIVNVFVLFFILELIEKASFIFYTWRFSPVIY